jgi:inorganic pyrophosphatase
LTKIYEHVKEIDDLPKLLLDQIKHFFEHYKDLEPNKWVKVDGFEGSKAAKADIQASVARYKA